MDRLLTGCFPLKVQVCNRGSDGFSLTQLQVHGVISESVLLPSLAFLLPEADARLIASGKHQIGERNAAQARYSV